MQTCEAAVTSGVRPGPQRRQSGHWQVGRSAQVHHGGQPSPLPLTTPAGVSPLSTETEELPGSLWGH